jgi:hypothetical protein
MPPSDKHDTTADGHWVFAAFAIWLCAVLIAGCSNSEGRMAVATKQGAREGSTGKTVMSLRAPDGDGDGDNNDDEAHIRDYGRSAPASEWHAIATLIRKYHRASVLSDGVKMCSSISVSLADALAEEQTGSGDDVAKACAKRVAILLRGAAARPGSHAKKIAIVTVRIMETSGLGLLRLPSGEEREETVVREGKSWKIAALFDMGMI